LAGTAVRGRLRRLRWHVATVRDVVAETPRARTIVVDVDDWTPHRAGQHVDLRLTAEDGYQAQRSYSIASAPEADALELTVERVDDGEVSPYLVDELRAGDVFELRGPIGGHFIWSADEGGPLLLVAGGSGLVPLMSMLRHRSARRADAQTHVLVSARSRGDLLYADELATLEPRDGLRVALTYTREAPPGWTGWTGRIDENMIGDISPGARARAFVCGPTPFVEAAIDLLVAGGHDPREIRAERFGPTGE
jgi:ferredoxin-NADP reductase